MSPACLLWFLGKWYLRAYSGLRITCIFEIQEGIEKNLFGDHTLDGVVHCIQRQSFGLVCWSVMVCFSLVLSNHSLVFLVLPIAVYTALWLGKMKHCICLLSSKREDMVEKRRPQPLGQGNLDNQGQGAANPEILKISQFLNGLVYLCLFQTQLLMIM